MEKEIEELRQLLKETKKERDAYRRAKAENDERFCNERDAARRERDEAKADLETLDRMYDELQADWHKTLDERTLLKKEMSRDYQSAVDLLRIMVRDYANRGGEVSPEWAPLETLSGVLSQIDNMYAGLRNDYANLLTAKTRAEKVLDEFEQILGDCDPEGRRLIINAPEDPAVLALCQSLGFGAVMDSAARQWRKQNEAGAFTVGPCVATLKYMLKVTQDIKEES